MLGLNYELEQREIAGQPVRVGLVGAGQMGTDVVATTKMMKGIRVVVTADLDLERAIAAYKIAQIEGRWLLRKPLHRLTRRSRRGNLSRYVTIISSPI